MPSQTRIIDLSGFEELLQKLRQLGDRAPALVGAALYREAEAVMTESKKKCPVDTGNLRDTGHVSEPENRGGHVVVTLGYGGPAAPYAIVQHEGDFQHTTGEKKFLESAMLEAANGMEARVAEAIGKAIEDEVR